MMFLLNEAGYDATGDVEGSDVVIINTCAFIESAKTEAIDTIIEIGELKRNGRVGKIIVAGCLPERYKNEIMLEMPEIDAVVGTGSFGDVVDAVNCVTGGGRTALFGDINAPVSETGRIITTSPVWAYLRIAEGCDNRCAYCVIPEIRGRFRSREISNIVTEAAELVRSGIRELILVAQDLTRYGLDIYGKRSLAALLNELCSIDGLRWIRLHYLYPDEIDEEIIDVIIKNDKILKYLDIPIQHISDVVLWNMRRRGSGKDIRELFSYLRERIEGLVIRTSLIAGLPYEGEEEFDELCAFLREVKIERAGVFAYSPEEGTDAAEMDRPDADVASRRAELLTDIQSLVMDEYNLSRVGRDVTVLVERRDGDRYYGRSYAESPDVDGFITIIGDDIGVNEFVEVRITGAEQGELFAEVLGDEVLGDETRGKA
ncbi:MAG: 30S ribosomal protein S12 methylthiotransferase RimO [Oscillospiraceae bacterium]|nr:30S ribosomal protein S12 methylthiotransferase RimO [Oscillospiraceae bacterium]